MNERYLPHLVILCLLLIGVCAGAFYSQNSKRHVMSAMYFEAIASDLEARIRPDVIRLAEWHDEIGFDAGPAGPLLREAKNLMLISRCLRAESNVLQGLASDDPTATRQAIDAWYESGVQEALREGVYPAGLRRLMEDKRDYLEFIRIRNQYIEPETQRWKVRQG